MLVGTIIVCIIIGFSVSAFGLILNDFTLAQAFLIYVLTGKMILLLRFVAAAMNIRLRDEDETVRDSERQEV